MEQSQSPPESRSYRDYISNPFESVRRDYRKADDLVGAYSDWDRSGGGCCCGGFAEKSDTQLFSDGTLLVLAAGAALAFYLLYTTVTAAAAGGRKKRSSSRVDDIESLIWHGLEEFEEKIDQIADGEDDGDENSWIQKIFNQFAFFNEVDDNEIQDHDLDGLEPPMLDEKWGLGNYGFANKNLTLNATVEDALNIDNGEARLRNKRATREELQEAYPNMDQASQDKCRLGMWRCFSNVIEGGLHYIDEPEGLVGIAKKTMFKVAFHSGFNNIWGGLMTIPEARNIKKCMSEHTECVSYEILRKEALETMDPRDPDVTMYQENFDNQEVEEKRERLIVNPEALPEDSSDGSVAYDDNSI